MEAKAIAKYVRMSPMKVGIVLDLIRDKNVNEAFAILQYTPKDAAVVVNKPKYSYGSLISINSIFPNNSSISLSK